MFVFFYSTNPALPRRPPSPPKLAAVPPQVSNEPHEEEEHCKSEGSNNNTANIDPIWHSRGPLLTSFGTSVEDDSPKEGSEEDSSLDDVLPVHIV